MTCRLPDKKLATIGFGLTLRFLIALIAALALAGCPPNASDEAQKADLMLVLGTSLTVNPAASIPNYTLRNNGEVVIVNNMPTPLDSRAVQHFDDLGEVFEGLWELLVSSESKTTK
ncbi:hypothetical protein FACS189476_06120 [Spirochaetia bacterium]|nr:hypothetical protein FACS189476_06120 [Spirochaetia bacterium]